MTNLERVESEVDAFRSMILGKLSDAALDGGDSELSYGYLWLRDGNKWPIGRTEDGDDSVVWWYWIRDGEYDRSYQLHSMLPSSLFWDPTKPSGPYVNIQTVFPSESAAMRAAAVAVGRHHAEAKK